MISSKISLASALVICAATLILAGCYDTPDVTTTVQGWNDDQRTAWYEATQGSRLIPKAWFDALEKADQETPFAETGFLTSFGFLPPRGNSVHGMPIGFTVDRQADKDFKNSGLRWYDGQKNSNEAAEPWVGLNCAACHTGSYSQDGNITIVDGAPSLLNFQKFVEAVDSALAQTKADPAKWDRFNKKVLGGKDTPANRAKLASAFDQLLAWQIKTDQMNETAMRYGFGRLDAVGHIFNKILMFTGSEVRNGRPSNAPVSYPFLWDIWRQGRVQWNGVAANSRLNFPGDDLEYGALGRNTGEVLGVFGDIDLASHVGPLPSVQAFRSSVRPQNLMRMELMLQKLQAPKWPDSFPAPKPELVKQGRELFKTKCAGCHKTPDLQKKDQPTEVMLPFEKTAPENLTDIWMACNAYLSEGPTGPLEGKKDNEGNVMGDRAPVVDMLAASVKGALVAKAGKIVKEGFRNFFAIRRLPAIDKTLTPGDPRSGDRTTCLKQKDVLILGYKARPLDGIWATSPYLHNGSVASLYQLLLPADKRMKEFWVGGTEFDTTNVGYVPTEPGTGKKFLLKTRTDDGKAIEGNSNKGHEYGAADFSKEDRKALVEYMKTL